MAVMAAAGMPGVFTRIAGIAPAYSLAMYRVTSSTTDATGDMLKVNGNARAIPMLDDLPGVAPTKYPARIPNAIARATSQEAIIEMASAKPLRIEWPLWQRDAHCQLKSEFYGDQETHS